MLVEKLREEIKKAMLSKDTPRISILKIALGEIQTLQTRKGKISPDEEEKVVRKVVESNIETLKMLIDGQDDKYQKLIYENKVLSEFLPKFLTKDEIRTCLSIFVDQIKGADNDGKATGLAMGFFNKSQSKVNGKEVAEIVKEIRNV